LSPLYLTVEEINQMRGVLHKVAAFLGKHSGQDSSGVVVNLDKLCNTALVGAQELQKEAA
jgi:hypothetical protein